MIEYSKILKGVESLCVRAFGEALEVIPYTLAENAGNIFFRVRGNISLGLNPIVVVTELKNKHA